MCERVSSCQLENVFWVQSIPTSHNILTCNRHLAYTIRELVDTVAGTMDDPESPYAKPRTVETHRGAPVNNYAMITVKRKTIQDGKTYWT